MLANPKTDELPITLDQRPLSFLLTVAASKLREVDRALAAELRLRAELMERVPDMAKQARVTYAARSVEEQRG